MHHRTFTLDVVPVPEPHRALQILRSCAAPRNLNRKQLRLAIAPQLRAPLLPRYRTRSPSSASTDRNLYRGMQSVSARYKLCIHRSARTSLAPAKSRMCIHRAGSRTGPGEQRYRHTPIRVFYAVLHAVVRLSGTAMRSAFTSSETALRMPHLAECTTLTGHPRPSLKRRTVLSRRSTAQA